MTKNEALKLALEILHYLEALNSDTQRQKMEAITAIKQALADIKQDLTPVQKPRLDQGADYERGFIDGMQKQMQSSVDKAVNAMSQPAPVQEPVAWMLPGTDSFLTAALKKHHGVRAESYRTPLYTTPPAAPVQREHVTDKSCWCQPALDYKDPDTGAEVWVHNEPH